MLILLLSYFDSRKNLVTINCIVRGYQFTDQMSLFTTLAWGHYISFEKMIAMSRGRDFYNFPYDSHIWSLTSQMKFNSMANFEDFHRLFSTTTSKLEIYQLQQSRWTHFYIWSSRQKLWCHRDLDDWVSSLHFTGYDRVCLHSS